MSGTGQAPPGFGHRQHTRDPRAVRLMQLAFELELDGGHTQLARAIEQQLVERCAAGGQPTLSLNADGAIAAVAGDLGLDGETTTMLFTISRVPGLVAHALEEQRRQEAMRFIDPSKHVYDGPGRTPAARVAAVAVRTRTANARTVGPASGVRREAPGTSPGMTA